MESLNSESPVELVLRKIQELISDGTFMAGKKIPSERDMAKRFDTSRGYVRKALQQLEMYGIIEILPKKGIYVANLGVKSLDVLISNILASHAYRIEDLIETRSHLEFPAAELAASRGSDEDFEELKTAHKKYLDAFRSGESPLEEDHLFHLAIVKASKNKVLQSLISMITPDIIAMNKYYKETGVDNIRKNTNEHEAIFRSILARDVKKAGETMKSHMMNSRKRRLKE